MKINFISFICLIFGIANSVSAQQTKQQSIENAESGWHKVYNFKGAKESRTINGRNYSVAQLSLCDSFANWMQASYLPKGGIGDVKKYVLPEKSQYNTYQSAWPQGYGATAYTWNISYNTQGKLERVPETETPWSIQANGIPGWPIRDLSTETKYYFTLPSFESAAVDGQELKKVFDLSKVESLKPYITFWVKMMDGQLAGEFVLLCKDNQSPFVRITKAEYLSELESGIIRAYEKEKKKIYEQNAGNQKSIDSFLKYLDDKHARRLAVLKINKEKYKNRLHEPAEVSSSQPDIMIENTPDVFEGNDNTTPRIPVYTIKPGMTELCKKDNPQWILINWSWHPMNAKEKHMHESIIKNFNFDYVYNFFFDPAKVKGQVYQPKHSPNIKKPVLVNERSEKLKSNGSDAGIHFFDDFSSTRTGEKPVGWYSKISGAGSGGTVAVVDGATDQWAQLAGTTLTPNNLKKPFPQNFTFSYDVMVPQDFTWGAKGLVVILGKEKSEGNVESFIRLKLRPGSGGGNGEAEFETKFPSAYTSGTKWYPATGFSNNKKLNRITVSIRKSGEMLQVFIDKEKIAEYPKALPPALLFNALSFQMVNSDHEQDKYYISNIKITND